MRGPLGAGLISRGRQPEHASAPADAIGGEGMGKRPHSRGHGGAIKGRLITKPIGRQERIGNRHGNGAVGLAVEVGFPEGGRIEARLPDNLVRRVLALALHQGQVGSCQGAKQVIYLVFTEQQHAG
jgi:hypothetical protein